VSFSLLPIILLVTFTFQFGDFSMGWTHSVDDTITAKQSLKSGKMLWEKISDS
jgi:hypothetical protein